VVSGISFSGLASGLDTDEMLEKLMHIERAPIRQMETRRERQEVEREVWQQVHTQLSSFGTSLGTLTSASTFNSRSVQSADENVVDLQAGSGAEPGQHAIRIDRLATAHRVASHRFESAGDPLGLEGNFSILTEDGAQAFEVNESDSLRDIQRQINGADAGVRATIVDNNLVLTAASTGAAQRVQLVDGEAGLLEDMGLLTAVEASGDAAGLPGVEGAETLGVDALAATIGDTEYHHALVNADGDIIAVSADGLAYHALSEPTAFDAVGDATLSGDTNTFDTPVIAGEVEVVDDGGTLTLEAHAFARQLQEGVDAVFDVDGIAVQSATNTGISGAIEGVTLDLVGVGETEISVAMDTETTMDAIRGFVEQYNAMQTYLSELGRKEGLLQGDSTLMRLQSTLRRGVADAVGLGEDYDLDVARQIGIEIDRDGEMSLDEAQLAEALRESPESLRRMFDARDSTHGADGIARRLDQQLRTYLRYGDGVLAQRDRMYERRMGDIEFRIESMERRMERREESLLRQFTQLERMLSDMQSQGQWLEGQIANLNGNSGRR